MRRALGTRIYKHWVLRPPDGMTVIRYALGMPWEKFLRLWKEKLDAYGFDWPQYVSRCGLNYGCEKLWEIGHSDPVWVFNFSKPASALRCFHIDNLYPIDPDEDRRDGWLYSGVS